MQLIVRRVLAFAKQEATVATPPPARSRPPSRTLLTAPHQADGAHGGRNEHFRCCEDGFEGPQPEKVRCLPGRASPFVEKGRIVCGLIANEIFFLVYYQLQLQQQLGEVVYVPHAVPTRVLSYVVRFETRGVIAVETY